MIAYRIGDARRAIYDGSGAFLHGGRWNSPGRRVIYAGDSLALAMLEVLVHTNTGRIPPRHALVEIDIPDRLTVEILDPGAVPGWEASDELASRAYGDHWHASRRTIVLSVPSVVTWKTAASGRNLVVNQDHADAGAIKVAPPKPVVWDERLFAPLARAPSPTR